MNKTIVSLSLMVDADLQTVTDVLERAGIKIFSAEEKDSETFCNVPDEAIKKTLDERVTHKAGLYLGSNLNTGKNF